MKLVPIACSLSQDDLAGRFQRWHALANRAITDATLTDDGLRLRFRREPDVEAELLELAALEQGCCSFADWTVASDGDGCVMEVRGGSREAVAAVREMFAGLSAPAATTEAR